MRAKWSVVLASALAWSAAAQDSAEATDFRAMSDADLQARFEATYTEGFRDACRSKVPLFVELVRRNPGDPEYEARRLISGVFCADEEGRHAEGLKLLKQAERENLAQPLDPIGLHFANRLEDGAEALARLRSMANRGGLKDIPVDFAFAGIRALRAEVLEYVRLLPERLVPIAYIRRSAIAEGTEKLQNAIAN